MTYSEKLTSPHWQRKRQDILTRDNYTCVLCGDTETTLHVHHKEYIQGREPWDYPDDNFQTLCKHCHSFIELNIKNDVGDFEVEFITKLMGTHIVFIAAVMKGEDMTFSILFGLYNLETNFSSYEYGCPPKLIYKLNDRLLKLKSSYLVPTQA